MSKNIWRYSPNKYKPKDTPHTESVVVNGKALILKYENGRIIVVKKKEK
jgi:hypothetical protein